MSRTKEEKSANAFPATRLERSDADLVRECRRGDQGAWDDRRVNDYMVASHPARDRTSSQAPEGKCHAYLPGASTTVCGFGLSTMQRFASLRFNAQAPAVRCPLCARAVGANR